MKYLFCLFVLLLGALVSIPALSQEFRVGSEESNIVTIEQIQLQFNLLKKQRAEQRKVLKAPLEEDRTSKPISSIALKKQSYERKMRNALDTE